MSTISRVFGIKRDGTFVSAETEETNHNTLALELYEPFINTLTAQQMEIAEGAVSAHWPIAGAVVKNRKDLIFLEILGEDVDIPFCVTLVPTLLSSKQIQTAKRRYETMSDMYFMDQTNCNGTEFVTHVEFKPFESLYEYLSEIQREKEEELSIELC